MQKPGLAFISLLLIVSLQSCEFSCTIGGKKDDIKGTAVVKDGARIYNDIQLYANNVKVEKAYLVFEDGSAMPEGNLVDFTKPVLLKLVIEDGWTSENGKVSLGAAERITLEDGSVLLDEKDLFNDSKFADGISAKDARNISLTANIRLKEDAPPATFTVSFRVWDKKGDGYVEGSYKLYSK